MSAPRPAALVASQLKCRLVVPAGIDTWSLTSPQQRLVKAGRRLSKHARYYWLVLWRRGI